MKSTLASPAPTIHQAPFQPPSRSPRASSSSCPEGLLTRSHCLPSSSLKSQIPLLYGWRPPFPPHLSSGFLPPLSAPLASYLHPHFPVLHHSMGTGSCRPPPTLPAHRRPGLRFWKAQNPACGMLVPGVDPGPYGVLTSDTGRPWWFHRGQGCLRHMTRTVTWTSASERQ